MIDFSRICKTIFPILISFGVFILFIVIVSIVFFIINCIRFDAIQAFQILIDWFSSKKTEYLIGLIVGIIAIYFGVQAMHEASNAVKKSDQIINTISSFFNDFQTMLPRACTLISEANEELLIMVSLPSYGYLINTKLGEDFFNILNKKITDASAGSPDIKFICFSQDKCSDFEDKNIIFQTESFSSLNENEKKIKLQTYFSHKKTILTGLFDIMNNKKINNNDYHNLFTLMQDPYLRIFIADRKKALFAITPDFNSTDLSDFNITGYYTEDKKMVDIITSLFYKYASQNPISSPDFSLFSFESQ